MTRVTDPAVYYPNPEPIFEMKPGPDADLTLKGSGFERQEKPGSRPGVDP